MLRASSGIGDGVASDLADIDLVVERLAAWTDSGDINLENSGTLAIETFAALTIDLAPDVASTAPMTITAGPMSGLTIADSADDNSASDMLTVRATSPLTVSDSDPVANHDGGSITLAAEGSLADLTINARVVATGGNGNIVLLAGRDLLVTDSSSVPEVSSAGAGAIIGVAGRDLTIPADVTLKSITGNITLEAADTLDLQAASVVSTGGNVTLNFGTDHNGGLGLVYGTIATNGNAVKVNSGDGTDHLVVELDTAVLPAGGLDYSADNDNLNAANPGFDSSDDLMEIRAAQGDFGEVICIDDNTNRIRWQGATVVLFSYESVNIFDLQTREGDDQVTFRMSPDTDPDRPREIRFDGGLPHSDPSSPVPSDPSDPCAGGSQITPCQGEVRDGLRIIGTDSADRVVVVDEQATPLTEGYLEAKYAASKYDNGFQGEATSLYQQFVIVPSPTVPDRPSVETVQIFGNGGDDYLINETSLAGGVKSLISGDAGRDWLLGGANCDIVFGGDGRDHMYGHEGDDFLLSDHRFTYSADGTPHPTMIDPITDEDKGEEVDGGPGTDVLVAFYDNTRGGEIQYAKGGTISIEDWLRAVFPNASDEAIESLVSRISSTAWVGQFHACPTPSIAAPLSDIGGEVKSDLGAIDFQSYQGLQVPSDGLMFSAQASRVGYFTVMATASESVLVELLDVDLNVVASANTMNEGRLDVFAEMGQSFYVRLTGNSSNLDLTLANLVDHQDSTVSINGTEGDDQFVFDPSGSVVEVAVNGLTYGFSPAAATTFHFNGRGGTDGATLIDSDGDDTLETNLEGTNGATLSGVSQSGYDYSAQVTDVAAIHGYAHSGGHDRAIMNGTAAADKFKGYSSLGKILGNGLLRRAKFFEEVTVDSGDGFDTAILYGTSADEHMTARPDATEFTDALGSFFYEVNGFNRVIAYGSEGRDTVEFFDSPENDVFRGLAHKSQMYREALDGAGERTEVYNITARAFDVVLATASEGFDKARLIDSEGDDQFDLRADTSRMDMPAASVELRGWDKVDVFSTSGGIDTAEVYDAPGDGCLVASDDSVEVYNESDELLYRLLALEQVRAHKTDGNDTADVAGDVDYLQLLGDWD